METEMEHASADRLSRERVRLLLRPEEAGDALGISRARLFQLLAEGNLKSLKIGRSRRIPISEIERWVDAELAEQSASSA
jgi:excisionase family DNA binding protein